MKFKHIPITDIRVPEGGRELDHGEEMNELNASIERYDVLQPIIVRPTPEGYVLVTGRRRLHALSVRNEPMAPCVIRDDISESDAVFVRLVENTHRRNLSPPEILAAVEEIRKQIPGISNTKIGVMLGRSGTWVRDQEIAAQQYEEMLLDGVDAPTVEQLPVAQLKRMSESKHEKRPYTKRNEANVVQELGQINVYPVSETSAFIACENRELFSTIMKRIDNHNLSWMDTVKIPRWLNKPLEAVEDALLAIERDGESETVPRMLLESVQRALHEIENAREAAPESAEEVV